MPQIVTLSEDPRAYLSNRANRLDRLCQLKAPASILRGEVALILQALAEVVKQEEPGVAGSNLPAMITQFREELAKDRYHAHDS